MVFNVPRPNLPDWFTTTRYYTGDEHAFLASFERLQEFAAQEGRCDELTHSWMECNREGARDVWEAFGNFLSTKPQELFWLALSGMFAEERLKWETKRDEDLNYLQHALFGPGSLGERMLKDLPFITISTDVEKTKWTKCQRKK